MQNQQNFSASTLTSSILEENARVCVCVCAVDGLNIWRERLQMVGFFLGLQTEHEVLHYRGKKNKKSERNEDGSCHGVFVSLNYHGSAVSQNLLTGLELTSTKKKKLNFVRS